MTVATADEVGATVDAVYRAESRRVLRHADPPARRLRPRRGGAARRLRAPRSSSGRATACRPTRAPGWSRPAASRRSTRLRRRARFDASLAELAEQLESATDDAAGLADDEDVEDDRLRLIFTCCHPALPPGRAGRADAARGLRPHHRGDRARVPDRAAHAGAAHRARQGQDPRRAIPYQVPARAELPERLDAVLRVIYLVFNEGYSASSGDVADAARSLGRGDPPGAAAGRAAAGARGDRPAGADAAARIAARGAHLAGGRPDPARRSGPLALEPRPDRRGHGAGRAGAGVAPVRPVHAPGGDRGGARRGADRRRDRLGADRRALRRAAAGWTRRRWSS